MPIHKNSNKNTVNEWQMSEQHREAEMCTEYVGNDTNGKSRVSNMSYSTWGAVDSKTGPQKQTHTFAIFWAFL
jgi:hypothetical protein